MKKNNYITYFDTETTGLDVLKHEIITAYFLTEYNGELVDDLYVEIKPNRWSKSAEAIHRIPMAKARKFGSKTAGLDKIFNYLKKYKGTFICHANWNNFNQETKKSAKYYYDWTMIKMLAFDLKQYYDFCIEFQSCTIESTHTLAKSSIKLDNYRLNTIYDHFFNDSFDHHDAKADVYATRDIYHRLKEVNNEINSTHHVFNNHSVWKRNN